MMKFSRYLVSAGTLALAAAAFSGNAVADEERKFGYSATISATSDYIFRGLSLNNEDPAFQPSIEFTYGIAYFGLWGSNVSGAAEPFEMDVMFGIRPVTGPINWDIGVLWYTYPDAKDAGDLDYVEFKLGASTTPMTNLTLGLTGYFTPDQSSYGQTETIEGTINYQLPQFAMFTPTVGGVLGYSSGDDGFSPCACGTDDYTYWNAGLKLSVDKFFMDFRYWDTDISRSEGADNYADSRFVFSAGVTLP